MREREREYWRRLWGTDEEEARLEKQERRKKLVLIGSALSVVLLLVGVWFASDWYLNKEDADSQQEESSQQGSSDEGSDESNNDAEEDDYPRYPEVKALEPTPEGAESIVKFWIEARNYSLHTNDVSYLKRASYETCQYCNVVIDGGKKAAQAGETITGGDLTITGKYRDMVDTSIPDKPILVFFPLLDESASVIYQDSKEIGRDDAYTDLKLRFEVVYDNEHWQVLKVDPRS